MSFYTNDEKYPELIVVDDSAPLPDSSALRRWFVEISLSVKSAGGLMGWYVGPWLKED